MVHVAANPFKTMGRRENPRFENDPEQTRPGDVITYTATPEMIEEIDRKGRQKYWEEYENPKKRKSTISFLPNPKTRKKVHV